jgi:hypothetical protein
MYFVPFGKPETDINTVFGGKSPYQTYAGTG